LANDRNGDAGLTGAAPTRTVVLQPVVKDGARSGPERSPDAQLEETVCLALAIHVDVVASRAMTLARPRPATLFGSGVVEEVRERIAAEEAELVVVGTALSPVQQRNLERAWKAKVIDRTGLILEIFGERARTNEGQLQVELAALTYQRSRLVRSWTHLERQRGGLGFVGGPGESQIEIDRRLIDERIAKLKRELEQVRRTRGLHRRARERVLLPLVALVGYTNAGKSTLFNRLTEADVFAEDMLFATLDPTMRRFDLPSGRTVILSDTVGFISDLPHDLVAAFRATLEEVEAADVVLHVRDIADADSEAQRRDVEEILNNILSAAGQDIEDGVPSQESGPVRIEVLNKVDLLAPDEKAVCAERARRDHDIVVLSALKGEGCDGLLARIDAVLAERDTVSTFEVPIADGAAIAWLYDKGEVLTRRDEGLCSHLTVRLAPPDVARFRRRYPSSSVMERPAQ
jgi:GTP-binding protein HflX